MYMYMCMALTAIPHWTQYLVCKVKVHTTLWVQYVHVQFTVGGEVFDRPRAHHGVMVLQEVQTDTHCMHLLII